MSIKNFKDEELLAELERRQKPQAPSPKPVKNPDFTNLIDTATKGVERSIKDGFEDEDFSHYVYEAAMTAIYGKVYWTWRNGQKW